eukprot:250564-Pyramimonas_sp.AAC.1
MVGDDGDFGKSNTSSLTFSYVVVGWRLGLLRPSRATARGAARYTTPPSHCTRGTPPLSSDGTPAASRRSRSVGGCARSGPRWTPAVRGMLKGC